MRLDLRYLGRSEVQRGEGAAAVRFAPNLARPAVFFDGALAHPVRFREAMSALHAVVVSDLRFHKRDKSGYEAWKKAQAEAEANLHRDAFARAKQAELARIGTEAPPPGLEREFQRQHGIYWRARRQWARELSSEDPELFRHLVPCDPVVTVAPDVVFFEGFAKDESSYGCLSVDREAIRGSGDAGLGTTNVDYSLALYEHFQTLRTYRPTRLLVDPSGFEVKVQGAGGHREEKIDLPPSWLRGFGQISAAMGLPVRRVVLPVEVVYSVLAYLRRHREKQGPRSIRVQLQPGKPPVLTLDPWNVQIPSRGPVYVGEKAEEIKLWGRRRLMALARVLPLAERFEVAMLGSGLPSFWVAHMGEMRFTLALSGWTTNDWTTGANLELLAGTYRADADATRVVSRHLETARGASAAELQRELGLPREALLGALFTLARQGQVVHDVGAQRYRWRQVMPVALSEAVLGPESPELTEGRRFHAQRKVELQRSEEMPGGRRLVAGVADRVECEAILDADGAFSKAKCTCSHFRASGLRKGPCRHLLALHLTARAS